MMKINNLIRLNGISETSSWILNSWICVHRCETTDKTGFTVNVVSLSSLSAVAVSSDSLNSPKFPP